MAFFCRIVLLKINFCRILFVDHFLSSIFKSNIFFVDYYIFLSNIFENFLSNIVFIKHLMSNTFYRISFCQIFLFVYLNISCGIFFGENFFSINFCHIPCQIFVEYFLSNFLLSNVFRIIVGWFFLSNIFLIVFFVKYCWILFVEYLLSNISCLVFFHPILSGEIFFSYFFGEYFLSNIFWSSMFLSNISLHLFSFLNIDFFVEYCFGQTFYDKYFLSKEDANLKYSFLRKRRRYFVEYFFVEYFLV